MPTSWHAWLAVLLAWTAAGASLSEAAERKPNVLLVVADDMAWTDLGSFGSEISTPHLDALARRGVQFTSFHTSTSCSPTRSMLLSGTDNHVAGLGAMAEMLKPAQRGRPGYEGHLNDRVVSLAEVLRDAGYHTYMAGKWHLGHEPPLYPSARGFDRTLSLLFGGASHWADRFGLMESDTPVEYTRDGEALDELPPDFYSSRSYTDFLIEAIRANRGDGKPFLAYLAFTAPHDPMHVPEPWRSRYRGRYDGGYQALKLQRAAAAKERGIVPGDAPVPPRYRKVKPWDSLGPEKRALEARAMEVYAGMVSNMDHHYGRIEAFLRDIGEYENTIVIFLSDNGPNPFASEDYPGNRDGRWLARFDNSLENLGNPMSNYAAGLGWADAGAGPLSLFKMTMGEGGIRAPLLIDGPGVRGGRRVDGFTYVWDVMPTILSLADVTHPETHGGRPVARMRGRSLDGLLTGAASSVYDETEYVAGEMGGLGRWVWQGDYKAVWNAPHFGSGRWQLYDIANDPGETRDLAEAQPEKLAAMKAAWEDYAREVGVIWEP